MNSPYIHPMLAIIVLLAITAVMSAAIWHAVPRAESPETVPPIEVPEKQWDCPSGNCKG